MKKASKLIYSILFFVFLGIMIIVPILSSLGFFKSDIELVDKSDEYSISNYVFEAEVKQNNTIKVTEKISVDFHTAKHGIFRAVPEVSTYSYVNNNGDVETSKKYRLKYDVVYANVPYDVESESDYCYIRLGDEDEYEYSGTSKDYTLVYNIKMDSRLAQNDFFYFNTLGNLWDTTIENYSAKIKFEKEITEPNTKIYIGEYGSTDELTGAWNLAKKELTYSASSLAVGEGITLYVDLPESYFIEPFAHIPDIISVILIIICAFIVWRNFKKNSNKNFVIPIVQFKLEKNFTSADVGYIIDQKVNNKDIASLILLWAQKGYLDIVEEQKKTYLRKNKDADDNMKAYEKTLFNDIFKEATNETLIDINDIGEKIVDSVASTRLQIITENSKMFNKKANVKRGLSIVITAVVFGLVLFLINYQNVNNIFTFMAIPAGILVLSFLFLLANNRDKQYVLVENKKVLRIIAFSLMFVTLGVYCILSYDVYCDFLFNSFLSILLFALTTMCVYRYNVRTDEGIKELGDIVGLRNFILTTEKDRMEMLLKENPSAFYDVLPYAYVLEVYDTWCKKFEGIALDNPSWYSSDTNTFDLIHFNYVLSATTTSILSSINTAEIAKRAEDIASKANSIGGGHGGGFSGGGIGGGGGGSW